MSLYRLNGYHRGWGRGLAKVICLQKRICSPPRGEGALDRGGRQCLPWPMSGKESISKGLWAGELNPGCADGGEQVLAAPQTAGCLLQGSGAAWSNVARTVFCQVSQFRQDRKWGCEAVVRLPQHPVWPHYPKLCHRVVYGNNPVWFLPTTGLRSGSPNIYKTLNRSTWWVQGMDINLIQPLEHPPVFYSLSWL